MAQCKFKVFTFLPAEMLESTFATHHAAANLEWLIDGDLAGGLVECV
jgi:hypothetical protein